MRDPIVEEVRKHRMEHTRKFRGDLSAICADLRSIQIASRHKVVRLTPKKKEDNKGICPKTEGTPNWIGIGRLKRRELVGVRKLKGSVSEPYFLRKYLYVHVSHNPDSSCQP